MKTVSDIYATHRFFDTTNISEYSIDLIASYAPCVLSNDVLVIPNEVLGQLEDELLEALMIFEIK